MYSQGNLESKFAVFDAGSWRCETEASGERGSQHFFQSTCLQFSLCINVDYMQLFLYKRTHRNEREGLLDIVRHRLDIPHVGSRQNHCCQPRPMCSQHLELVFQYNSMEEQLLCKNAEIFPDDHLVTNSTNRKHETMQRNLTSHCLDNCKRSLPG